MGDMIDRDAVLALEDGAGFVDANAIRALPAVTVGVTTEDIDALAYRFWSIHFKDIPEPVGMPEGYRGGRRAWFYATEIRRILAALEPVTQPAPTAGERLIAAAQDALEGKVSVAYDPQPAPTAQLDAGDVREAAIRECADALRRVIDYAAFAGADPDEVDAAAINSYADYLLALLTEKPHDRKT